MSQDIPSPHHDSGLDAAAQLVTRGLEGGAAMYTLDHAARGTPTGAEGNPAEQAARTAGTFVTAVLWHCGDRPVSRDHGVIFAIPTGIAAVIIGGSAVASDRPIVAAVFVAVCVGGCATPSTDGCGAGSSGPSTPG